MQVIAANCNSITACDSLPCLERPLCKMDKLASASLSTIKVCRLRKGSPLVRASDSAVPVRCRWQCEIPNVCIMQEGQKALQQAHAEKGFIHLVGK